MNRRRTVVGDAKFVLEAHHTAAKDVTTFEDAHLEAGFGQVASGGEAVLSGTGDNNIVLSHFCLLVRMLP